MKEKPNIFTNNIGEHMINKFKNLKIVQKLTEVSPKLKWLMFSQTQGNKSSSDYINMICSDENISQNSSDTEKLEAMVRESLAKEFSSTIENKKSYELLVDAVLHNIKKKQLQAMGNQDEIA